MSELSLDKKIVQFLENTIGNKPDVFPLAGDASSRRYYRLVWQKKSWVLMVSEPFCDSQTFPFLNIQRFWSKQGIAVPEVIASSGNLGTILLEDLGDLTLERKFWECQEGTASIPLYRQAIDELIKIQFKTYFAPDGAKECIAFNTLFDSAKWMWEIDYALEHLVKKYFRIDLSKKELSEVRTAFSKLVKQLDNEPKYICHRDYHSRNLMIHLGKIRVIDFQDARLGPIQYDLVSLVRDSYVQMESSMISELVRYYFDQRAEYKKNQNLEDLSLEKFMEVFKMQSIQRCFKACGSFASFYNQREDSRYLNYLPNTLLNIRKIMTDFDFMKPALKVFDDRGVFESSRSIHLCQ